MHRLADGARILAGLLLALAGTGATAGAAEPAELAEPSGKTEQPAACGLVKEFDEVLEDRDAYPVDVLSIDSSPQDHGDTAFPLPPGPRFFELIERIPQAVLSVEVQGALDESIHKRNLTIDVKPNTVYVIGAKLLREHGDDPDAYWAPVIYQESGIRCRPSA